MNKQDNSIILMGYMAAGKSYIGGKLAETMSMPFIDTDKAIEKKEGKSINEIFNQEGEAYFRRLEFELLNSLSQMPPSIVALGGGMPCNDRNIALIKSIGLSIYLYLEPEILLKRLLDEEDKRPLLKNLKSQTDLFLFVKKQLVEREKYYLQADYVINANGSAEEFIQKLLELPRF